MIARLWVERICRLSTLKEIQDELDNGSLPDKLKDIYLRTLEAIGKRGDNDLAIAMKIFRWVLLAKRELTVDELRFFVAYDGAPEYSKVDETYLVSEAKIPLVCGSLIHIHPGTKRVDQQAINRTWFEIT